MRVGSNTPARGMNAKALPPPDLGVDAGCRPRAYDVYRIEENKDGRGGMAHFARGADGYGMLAARRM